MPIPTIHQQGEHAVVFHKYMKTTANSPNVSVHRNGKGYLMGRLNEFCEDENIFVQGPTSMLAVIVSILVKLENYLKLFELIRIEVVHKFPLLISNILKKLLLTCLIISCITTYFFYDLYLQSSDIIDQTKFELFFNFNQPYLKACFYSVNICFVFISILFLIWKYKLCKNIQNIQDVEFDHTPGWAVGFYFIPIWNLYKPYKVMTDLSTYLNKLNNVTPKHHLLTIWWVVLLVSILFENAMVDQAAKLNTPIEYTEMFKLIATNQLLETFLYLATYFVINDFIKLNENCSLVKEPL